MKISEVIKENRLKQGLTQEQLANYLMVSTPAVNKWEKAVSYPDITLLAPLARVLKIDVNQLLSFHDTLSDEEVKLILADIGQLIEGKASDPLIQEVRTLARKYPTTDLLLLNLGLLLQGLSMYDIAIDEETNQLAEELIQRASKSNRLEVKEAALEILFQQKLNEENFDEAEELLNDFSEARIDKSALKAKLMQKRGNISESYVAYESLLINKMEGVFGILSALTTNAIDENKFEQAGEYADIYKKCCQLFQWWAFNEELLNFQIAIAKKDKDSVINCLRHFVQEAQKPWRVDEKSLYQHVSTKIASSSFQKFLRERIMRGIQEDESLEFLKEEPEFLALLESFEKID